MTAVAWTVLLLGVVAVLYAATAGAYLFGNRFGMALAFVGYVIANVGLIWDALAARLH